jgi:adenylylsulfate kinase-like enzyme
MASSPVVIFASSLLDGNEVRMNLKSPLILTFSRKGRRELY